MPGQTPDLNNFQVLRASASSSHLVLLRLSVVNDTVVLTKWTNVFVCLFVFIPQVSYPWHLSINVWKKTPLAINEKKSVLHPRQCIDSVCKHIYVFMPGTWNKQLSPRNDVVVQALSSSNHGCVCTSKLSVVGTIPWCWGWWRWTHPYYWPFLPSGLHQE